MVMDAGLDSTGHEKDGGDTQEQEAGGHWGFGFSKAGSQTRASNVPDARKLAQDWITLWQSELTAMAADPEIQESWQTLMALWAGSLSSLLRGLPRSQQHERTDTHTRAADAPGASTTAAAPDTRDAEIERLARHVAALERRLADLERGGGSGGEPGGDHAVDPKSRPRGGKRRR